VAPSAIPMPAEVNGVPSLGVQGSDYRWYEHEKPTEMSAEEIDDVVSAFGNAAKLTKAAGFDGIEVHAGSGYLIDTFLQSCTNHREDRFGGSAEKRFTILSDVLAAISDWFPLSRVGVKFTPNNGFNGMGSPDVCETFLHYAARLDSIGIAYLHVTDGIGQATTGDTWFGRTKSSGYHGYGTPLTLAQLKSVFHGALIGNGGYTAQTAVNAVAAEEAAAISFGRIYMTNPDLVERFRDELPLSPLPPMDEWFVPTEELRKDVRKGYTDGGPYDASSPKQCISPRSPSSIYSTHEDLDPSSARGWSALERLLASDGLATAPMGVASAHGMSERETAARKLIKNHVRVLLDLTNVTKLNIDGKSLTQAALHRVAPEQKRHVDGFLRELALRLLGGSDELPAHVHLDASKPAQAAAWVASAAYLDARIQSTQEQCPGRTPDMSPASAAAMKAVMAELSCEAALLAEGVPHMKLPAAIKGVDVGYAREAAAARAA